MTIIPDSIAPKTAWRAWKWDGRRLVSNTNNMMWEPGVAARAICTNLGQGVPGVTLMVNVLEQGRADAIRNHMAQAYSPPVYEVDEGENRVYFTKRSYFVIPRAIPVKLQVPAMRCSCGIYATNNLEEAVNYGEILGRVAMWGHVIEHSNGYRAQFAYPQSLYVPDQLVETMKPLLADYGVPVLGLSVIRPRRSQSEAQEGPTSGYSNSILISNPTFNIAAVRAKLLAQYEDQTGKDEDEEEDISPGDGVKNVTVWSWLRGKLRA